MKQPLPIKIDAKILPLVRAANACGFITYGACQGHGLFAADHVYVAFRAKIANAARFADMIDSAKKWDGLLLRWGWEVTPRFDSEWQLVFSLTTTKLRRWWTPFWPRSLDRDLRSLCRLLQQLRYEFDQIEAQEILRGYKHEQYDENGHLQTTTRSARTAGINRSAFRTHFSVITGGTFAD